MGTDIVGLPIQYDNGNILVVRSPDTKPVWEYNSNCASCAVIPCMVQFTVCLQNRYVQGSISYYQKWLLPLCIRGYSWVFVSISLGFCIIISKCWRWTRQRIMYQKLAFLSSCLPFSSSFSYQNFNYIMASTDVYSLQRYLQAMPMYWKFEKEEGKNYKKQFFHLLP